MYNGVTICCFFEVEVALNALSNPVIIHITCHLS